MRFKTLATAGLLALFCCAAAAQTPSPTPRRIIRIGTPPGGAGGNTGGSTNTGSTNTGGTNTGGTNSGTTAPGQQGAGGTLICRMGGEMRWSLVGVFDLVQTQINGKQARLPVVQSLFDQLLYARATAPAKADGSGLLPGQCGWADRAMGAAEPDRVIADTDDFMLRQNVIWGNGSTLKGEAVVFGGRLNFQNKQVFSMQVAQPDPKQFKVVAGTYPKALTQ